MPQVLRAMLGVLLCAAAPVPPKPPVAAPARETATLSGTLRLKLSGQSLSIRQFLERAGYDSMEVEIAGVSGVVKDSGRYGLDLPVGSFRFDHLLLVHGDAERLLFIPATTVTVSGVPGPACIGTMELSWPSLASAQQDGFPSASTHEDCRADRYVPPVEAPDWPLPELGDPLWLRALVSPFAGASEAVTRRGATLVPTLGARITLFRNPSFLGTFRAVARFDLELNSTAISGGVEWGPWHGYVSLLLEGGFSDSNPRAGGGLVIAPLKHEAALVLRLDYLFVPGIAPFPTYSVGIDLAPFAILGALL